MKISTSSTRQLIVLALATAFLTNFVISGATAMRAFKNENHVLSPANTSSSLSSPLRPFRETTAGGYGKVPLSFEANFGQVDASVKFLARAPRYDLFLTATEAVLALTKTSRVTGKKNSDLQKQSLAPSSRKTTVSVLRVKFEGADPSAEVAGINQLPGKVNYLRGRDPKRWTAQVPTYAGVTYKNIYQGIDAVYYGNQQQLEYDFRVAPNANPQAIRLAFDGARKVRLDRSGDLILSTASGQVREGKPFAYQEENGAKQSVPARFVLKNGNQVAFELGEFDRSRALVIDPLVYSTYLGGSGNDFGSDIAVDSAGNAYVVGETASLDFPVTAGVSGPTYGGGNNDLFVTKLNDTGSAAVYSTYLGGSADEYATSIALDSSGCAYLTGSTTSSDFPTTAGAFQNVIGGDSDVFVTKLNLNGSALIYSTFIGGSGSDTGNSITVDSSGNAYIAGQNRAGNYPTTAGSFQPSFPGNPLQAASELKGVVTKLNASGTALIYSTYLGGTGRDIAGAIAIDASGCAYVTGEAGSTDFPVTPGAFQTSGANNAFVTKFTAAGNALVYSTYLGGGGDRGHGIAVDSSGSAYVTGTTTALNFPTTPGAYETAYAGNGGPGASINSFVTKMSAAGDALVYSTYLGSDIYTSAYDIAVDPAGDAFVCGFDSSNTFPQTAGAIPTPPASSTSFVSKFDPAGAQLLYSTRFGVQTDGTFGIALDSSGDAYVTGYTFAADFPTTPGAFQTSSAGAYDAFVAKIDPTIPANTPVGTNVVYQSGNVTVTFDQVTVAGNTTITPIPPASAGTLPGQYVLTGDSVAFEITTTASYAGSITVCIVDSSVADQATFDSLRILHGEAGMLVDRTILPPDAPAPDFNTRMICARVTSLSPFVIAKLTASYGIQVLFDQTKPVKSGSTLPVKLQLTSSTGANVSSASIVVTALSVVRISTNVSGAVQDSGNANPDNNFRFAGGSYIFNLSTRGYATGTYRLRFKAGSDPVVHTVDFQVK